MIMNLAMRRRLVWGIVVGIALAASEAGAQTREQLVERFRTECRAQLAHLRGPGQAENFRARMQDCVAARMTSTMRERATQMPADAPPLKLVEATPWLVENAGPAKAKGVIYFIRGYFAATPTRDDYRLPPYFLKSLNAAGWDVIDARVAHDEPNPGPGRTLQQAGRAVPFVRRRLAALKQDGYRKVVLAGHSWGGWLSMLVAGEPVADAVIVNAPNAFGRSTAPNGRPNATFAFTLTQFAPAVGAVKIPAFVILPEDPIWDPDPGERGRIAEERLTAANVPHYVMAKPPAFTGHFTSWLPIFDFAYGKCIAAFLDDPHNQERSCERPPLAADDFRSVIALKQIADAEPRRITTAAQLAGRKFAVYARGAEDRAYDFLSAAQLLDTRAVEETRAAYEFRGGKLCVAAVCSTIVGWPDGNLLEFDPGNGNLRAWWVERRP